MDEHCVESLGFHVSRWSFPPFTLRRGESVTLQLPQESRADHDIILAALTGAQTTAGLNLRGSIVRVQPATTASGIWRWFHDPTPLDWLRKNTELPDDAIQAILKENKMDRRNRVSHYASNPRMVLGLYAAYAKKPAAIIFSTGGLDPLGVLQVYRIVGEHLAECAAIYLAWPFYCDGKEQCAVCPGSTVVSVVGMVAT